MKTAEFEAPGDPKAVAFSQMDTMEMCLLPELLWLCHAVMVLPTSLHSWGLWEGSPKEGRAVPAVQRQEEKEE